MEVIYKAPEARLDRKRAQRTAHLNRNPIA